MKLPLVAEPENIEFDPARSAVLVSDMQNYDCKPGGFFDLVGTDFTHGAKTIEPIRRLLEQARRAEVPVIYTEMVLPADRRLWPDEESPWHRKANPKQWEGNPELERGLGAPEQARGPVPPDVSEPRSRVSRTHGGPIRNGTRQTITWCAMS